MLLGDIIELNASKGPDRLALVVDDRSFTYGQMSERVRRLAVAMTGLASPGQRVAILAENIVEYVDAYYGVPSAGLALVLLNYRLNPHELAWIIHDSDASVLIVESSYLDAVLAVRDEWPNVQHIVVIGPGGGATSGVIDYDELVGSADAGASLPRCHEDDIAWQLYTSGTTGRPKGAMLTHRSLLTAILNAIIAYGVKAEDRAMLCFPMCHVSGYLVTQNHLAGASMVLMRSYSPELFMELVDKHRINSTGLAPTMMTTLLQHPRIHDYDLSTLTSIGYGAAAMPVEVLKAAIDRFGPVVWSGFGMTEVSGNVLTHPISAHVRAVNGEEHLLAACGLPMTLAAVRVVDEEMNELPPGQVGEIVIQGEQLLQGYSNQPEATREAFRGGWFHTGDMARRDEEGFFYIVDRKKDNHHRRGERVLPGGGGGALRPPGGGRSGRDQPSRCHVGGTSDGCGHPAAGSAGQRRRYHRPLPAEPRRVQVAEAGDLRRRAPEDGERQDPQTRPARALPGALTARKPGPVLLPAGLRRRRLAGAPRLRPGGVVRARRPRRSRRGDRPGGGTCPVTGATFVAVDPSPRDVGPDDGAARTLCSSTPTKCAARTRLYREGAVASEGFPVAQISDYLGEAGTMVWLDLFDPDMDDLSVISEEVGLHPLAVEGAVHEHQRPKLDRYKTHLFLNAYGVRLDTATGELETTEVAAFITPKAFVTVRKNGGLDMNTVIDRWDQSSDLAVHGVGYLLQGLLDVIVDSHFSTVQALDGQLDDLEDQLFGDIPADREVQRRSFELRKSLVLLRREVLPMREVVNALLRRDLKVVDETLQPYYQDI